MSEPVLAVYFCPSSVRAHTYIGTHAHALTHAHTQTSPTPLYWRQIHHAYRSRRHLHSTYLQSHNLTR